MVRSHLSWLSWHLIPWDKIHLLHCFTKNDTCYRYRITRHYVSQNKRKILTSIRIWILKRHLIYHPHWLTVSYLFYVYWRYCTVYQTGAIVRRIMNLVVIAWVSENLVRKTKTIYLHGYICVIHTPPQGPPQWTHESPLTRTHTSLIFSLICAWTHGWVNNRYASDLRRYRTHYDLTVMCQNVLFLQCRFVPIALHFTCMERTVLGLSC